MEIMWFLLGALAVGMAWSLRTWIVKKRIMLSALSWSGIVADILLILFTLAWVISSIEEGENQAAGMGLLLIGGSSLVVFALTRKRVMKDIAVKANA